MARAAVQIAANLRSLIVRLGRDPNVTAASPFSSPLRSIDCSRLTRQNKPECLRNAYFIPDVRTLRDRSARIEVLGAKVTDHWGERDHMNNTTRRQAMAAATLGTAAALVSSPAQAQASPGTPSKGGKQDPRTKYPKPPFQPQSQPWPGLASKMDPRPDHGETSYVGSGR
jgi:hypothetical protein